MQTCFSSGSLCISKVLRDGVMSLRALSDSLTWLSCRWTGREMLRQQLLGREGKLVLLNQPKPGAVVEVVARYLKPLLEAATEGCLDSYKTTVTS